MADQEQKQPTRKSRPSKAKSAYAIALEKVQSEQTSQPSEQRDIQDPEQPNIQPATHTDRKISNQQKVKTAKQKTIQTEEQPTSKTKKQQRTKATYYLDIEDIIAIDTIQIKRYRATHTKPEKSELVSEAIQLLFKQENS